jgi:hypothetical protein
MASKEQVIVPLLAFTYGITINLGLKKSFKFLIFTFVIFIFSNTLINNIRYSFNYSDSNSFVDRSEIIVDVINSQITGDFYRKSVEPTPSPEIVDAHEMNKMSKLINSVFYRFDVLTVQGFIIKSYDGGKGGDSISRILLTVTPRIFFKDKMIYILFKIYIIINN